MHLLVRLLGDLQVRRGTSGAIVPVPARKVRALLAYLAVHPGRAHPRDRLTGLSSRFGAMWSTNMGVSLRRFEEQLGRALGEDEFEPMNRVQAEFAAHISAVDYALALSATTHFRRALQS